MRFFPVGIVGLVLTIGLGAGCDRPKKELPPDSESVKLILVGLDGASWNLVDPLLDRGALPQLQKLIEQGARAYLKTERPCLSIVLWTSMATGKRPEQHGITDWGFVDERTGKGQMSNSSIRRVEALWNIVGLAGHRVGFVNWHATWPAEPVRGYVVSDQFTRREVEDLEHATYPVELAAELESVSTSDWPWLHQVLESGQLKTLADRDPALAAKTQPADRYKQAAFLYGQDHLGEQAATHLLSTWPRPILFGFHSGKIDIASHYMWWFLPEDERDYDSYSDVLEPIYAYEDRMLGHLMDLAGPDVDVIVVSDHGFERYGDGYDHEETAPDGIFIASGPSFRSGVDLGAVTLYDIAPTVLHALGLPVGRDLPGEVLEEALAVERPIRWVETYETGSRPRRYLESPLEDRIREKLRSLGYIQ